MALKAVVDKIEDVAEAIRAEYEPIDGGGFALKLEGLEDGSRHPAVGSLVRSKKRVSDDKTKAEARAKELSDKLEAATTEMEQRLKGVIPKADADRLELSYKTKLDETTAAIRSELTGEITTLSTSLRRVLVDNVAQKLATELAGDGAPVLQPHIMPRLAVEMVNGEAVTRVLDKDGKASAATLDDLKKEILSTKIFAPILIGSKASGGGASGNGGGGAPPKNLDLSKATMAEKVAYYESRNK